MILTKKSISIVLMAVKAKTNAKPRGKSFTAGNAAAVGHGAPVKEMRISTWIEKELDAVLGTQKEKELGHEYQAEVSRRQALARKLVNMALHKSNEMTSMAAIREVLDRTEGKPQQKVDHTTLGEKMPTPLLGSIPTEASEDVDN